MKKSLLLGAVLLGAASFSFLTGFDSAATVDDVLQNYTEATKNITDVSASADFNVDVNVEIPSAQVNMGIKASGTEDVAVKMDPLSFKADASVTASMLGTDVDVAVSVYGIDDGNGNFSIYSQATEGGETTEWTKVDEDISSFMEIIENAKNNPIDFSSLPVEFVLSPEAYDIDGAECYEVSADISVNDMFLLIEPYMNQLEGQGISASDMQTAQSLLSGLVVSTKLYIDTTSYLPVMIHLDFDQSEWSTIGALIGSMFGTDENGNAYEVSLNINSLEMDMFYDYETPVEIVLPADAASAKNVDSDSLLEMVENAADDAA